jgi:hypothetical protein
LPPFPALRLQFNLRLGRCQEPRSSRVESCACRLTHSHHASMTISLFLSS